MSAHGGKKDSRIDSASKRSASPRALSGIDATRYAFHFVEGPADVLRAATASRRWRELACSESVWRAKSRHEDILSKARAFEVPCGCRGASP